MKKVFLSLLVLLALAAAGGAYWLLRPAPLLEPGEEYTVADLQVRQGAGWMTLPLPQNGAPLLEALGPCTQQFTVDDLFRKAGDPIPSWAQAMVTLSGPGRPLVLLWGEEGFQRRSQGLRGPVYDLSHGRQARVHLGDWTVYPTLEALCAAPALAADGPLALLTSTPLAQAGSPESQYVLGLASLTGSPGLCKAFTAQPTAGGYRLVDASVTVGAGASWVFPVSPEEGSLRTLYLYDTQRRPKAPVADLGVFSAAGEGLRLGLL